MSGFAFYIVTSLALVLVIEGLIYALFPDSVRKMFVMALSLPVPRLRLFGAVMAVSGFCIVLILQSFAGR